MFEQLIAIGEYPALQQEQKRSFSDKLLTLIKAYGVVFFSIILVAAPVIVLTDYLVVHALHFKGINSQGKVSMSQFIHKLGYWKAILYVCLIGPVIEETIFRLPLSFKKVYLALSIAFAAFLFSSIIPGAKELNHNIGVWYAFAVKLAASVIIFFAVWRLMPSGINISDKLKTRVIIASMCLFGLMHISNYSPLQWPIIWLYPIYVLPQFFMGWLITFVRFKNGFIWGIALHCLINSVSMAFTSVYSAPFKAKINHTTISNTKMVTDTITRPKSRK